MTDAVAQFEFAAPALESQAVSGQVAVAQFNFPAPTLEVAANYNVNVSRPVFSAPAMGWEDGIQKKEVFKHLPWESTEQGRTHTAFIWEVAQKTVTERTVLYAQAPNLRKSTAVAWDQAEELKRFYSSVWEENERVRKKADVIWEETIHVAAIHKNTFEYTERLHTHKHLAWDVAQRFDRALQLIANTGKNHREYTKFPWEMARKPPIGYSGDPFAPPKPDPSKPIIVNLNFECLLSPDPVDRLWLNFGQYGCRGTTYQLHRGVYFIVHTMSLKRVSDNTPVEMLKASFGTDKASWAWTFSLTIPRRELEKVEPTPGGPIELELTLNGVSWRFLVESYDESETFATPTLSIKGRSVTAYLDSPYAPPRTFNQTQATTTRQLAEAELTRPGLISGFTLDWVFPDELGWSLPPDTWSFAELTPIAVINQIVQGSGGFLNSHHKDKKLIVRPEYKIPPWEWGLATPDKVIPRGLIKSRSLQWSEKPLYNGVYVSGERTGVNALVRRTGTGATFLAPAFSSPFITAQDAARIKGTQLLSQGGKQSQNTLVLPFDSNLGLMTPGMLIEVSNVGSTQSDWRGMLGGISFDLSFDKSKGPTVNQSLTLERHYGGL